jgi:hypothetical protein
MSAQSLLSFSQKDKTIFIKEGIAVVLCVGFKLVGQPIANEHPHDLLAILKATQFDPSDQELIDFVIVMLTTCDTTNLTEVRALIEGAKKIIPELEGNFEESLQAIAIF